MWTTCLGWSRDVVLVTPVLAIPLVNVLTTSLFFLRFITADCWEPSLQEIQKVCEGDCEDTGSQSSPDGDAHDSGEAGAELGDASKKETTSSWPTIDRLTNRIVCACLPRTPLSTTTGSWKRYRRTARNMKKRERTYPNLSRVSWLWYDGRQSQFRIQKVGMPHRRRKLSIWFSNYAHFTTFCTLSMDLASSGLMSTRRL